MARKISDATLGLIHCGLEIPFESTVQLMDEELASYGWEGDFTDLACWKAREIRRLRGDEYPDRI